MLSNLSSVSRNKSSVFLLVLALIVGGVGAQATGLLNTASGGYLVCVNSSTKVVTHPGTSSCPKGSKKLILGAQGPAGTNGKDGKTTIASLVLSTVEQGTSLATLVDMIAEKIDTSRSAKLMNAVVATLGVPPQLVTSLSIDLKATRDSLRLIAATDVPRPLKSSGVLSMNWIANLDSISSIESHLDSLLKGF